MKATGNTMITIKAHEDVSVQTVLAIRSKLIEKGLPRVVIAKQNKPQVFLKKKRK